MNLTICDNKEEFMGFRKTWPRPRMKCEDCGNNLVLKWGNEKIPHFSHI